MVTQYLDHFTNWLVSKRRLLDDFDFNNLAIFSAALGTIGNQHILVSYTTLEPLWRCKCGPDIRRLDLKEKDRLIQRFALPQQPPAVTQNLAVTLRDDYYKLMPFVDLGGGVRFEHTFRDYAFRILLSAGWETHFIFDYNELLRGTNPSSEVTDLPSANGNLTLSGFVLRGRLDF